MRVTFDSNILVHASAREEDDRHRVASELLIRAVSHDVVLTAQALAEYLNVIRRKRPEDFAAACDQAKRWATLFSIVETKATHVLAAADFALRHRLQFWDSLIWQVARSEQVRLLVSEDLQDGLSLEGITVINPFKPGNEARVERLFTRA